MSAGVNSSAQGGQLIKVHAQKLIKARKELLLPPGRIAPHAIGNRAIESLLYADAEGSQAESGTPAPANFAHDFSRIPIHAKAPVRLQTKLKVNTPGDIYEQEADRLSEQAMSVTEPRRQPTSCACVGGCPACRNEQAGDEGLQAKRIHGPESGQVEASPAAHELLRSSGNPVDQSTRAFMESRFGHDFSQVRVHTDARAMESAKALRAQAYTVGQHIAFGEGQYRPHLQDGRKLLAHELAHTLQQRSGTKLNDGIGVDVGSHPSLHVLQRQTEPDDESTSNKGDQTAEPTTLEAEEGPGGEPAPADKKTAAIKHKKKTGGKLSKQVFYSGCMASPKGLTSVGGQHASGIHKGKYAEQGDIADLVQEALFNLVKEIKASDTPPKELQISVTFFNDTGTKATPFGYIMAAESCAANIMKFLQARVPSSIKITPTHQVIDCAKSPFPNNQEVTITPIY